MAKRIVIKVGNIFCAQVGDKYKFYFQFLCRDLTCLNSPVIRVFKRRYPLDANPTMDEIVSDEVCFYTHCYVRWGCELGIWEKVGTSKELGLDELDKVWFGLTFDRERVKEYTWIDVDPRENLWIWHVNQEKIKVGKFEKGKELDVEDGGIFPADWIVKRFKYGYYRATLTIYYHVKRRPWDDVDTYSKLKDVETGDIAFFHFLGEKAIQIVIITSNGKKYRLDKEHPREGEYKLMENDFGDIFWEHKDFITTEEFYAVWN